MILGYSIPYIQTGRVLASKHTLCADSVGEVMEELGVNDDDDGGYD